MMAAPPSARRWHRRIVGATVSLVLLVCGAVEAEDEVRVVALAPHIVEMLFAMGAGPQVVGAVSYSDFPPEAASLPQVGNYRSISVEGVMRLEPTLVIAMDDSVSGVSRIAEMGIRVEYSYPSSVEGVLADIGRIGSWVGREPEAARLQRSLRRRLAEIESQRPAVPWRVFYEIWHSPLRTAGGPSFISNALEAIGAANVFSELAFDAPRVSPEAVLRASPDVIIVPGEARDVAEREAEWRTLFEPVSKVRVVEAEPDLMHRPGPRIVEGMARLQAALLQRDAGESAE